MKVEVELTQEVVEMLERYREKRIKHYEDYLKSARSEMLKNAYLEQIKFCREMEYKYLVFEYLNHQAHFEDKKTD